MFEIWVRRLIFVTKFSFKTAWFWESFGRGNFFPCPEFVGFNVRFVRFLRVSCAFLARLDRMCVSCAFLARLVKTRKTRSKIRNSVANFFDCEGVFSVPRVIFRQISPS